MEMYFPMAYFIGHRIEKSVKIKELFKKIQNERIKRSKRKNIKKQLSDL